MFILFWMSTDSFGLYFHIISKKCENDKCFIETYFEFIRGVTLDSPNFFWKKKKKKINYWT